MPGLRYRDIHETIHLLLTAGGIMEGVERLGIRTPGLLKFPMADTEFSTLLGRTQGPLLSMLKNGQGPIRRILKSRGLL